MGSFQDGRIVRIVPFHQLFDQPKEPLPLLILVGFGRELLGKTRRVIDQRSEQDRPARRQRPPRPPEMQRRRVSMPDRFLPRRFLIDRLQRQRDFDKLLLHLSSVHFHAFRTASFTSRRRSAVSTPKGASSTHAFAIIAIIFLSSSDHEAGPLALASTTNAARSHFVMSKGLRILAASIIVSSCGPSGLIGCFTAVRMHGSEYRFAYSLPSSTRNRTGSPAGMFFANRRTHDLPAIIVSAQVPRGIATSGSLFFIPTQTAPSAHAFARLCAIA